MTEDTQCETMGLQATSPPTSPLHRPPPAPASLLKRKHDVVEEEDDVLMSATVQTVKKICVEVVCDNDNEVHSYDHHRRHRHSVENNSEEDDDEDIDDDDEEEDDDDDDDDSSSRSNSTLEDALMIPTEDISSDDSAEENKENHDQSSCTNKNHNKSAAGELDSILAKTLLSSTVTTTTTIPSSPPATNDNNKENLSSAVEIESPKVIVEHQPLPSIYDLHQMSAACDTLEDTGGGGGGGHAANGGQNFDSGLSDVDDDDADDDDDEDDDVTDCDADSDDGCGDDDESVVHVSASPIFDPVLRGTPAANKALLPTPPKAIYNDRFWNQGAFSSSNANNSGSGASPQGPTATPVVAAPNSPVPNNTTFQFLEQTTQRIECAENGKSYLQLGTMNHHTHHHLPVTPIIQPKPNMVYRRPIPPFRNPMASLAAAHQQAQQAAVAAAAAAGGQTTRPVCDHSNCLQRKTSFCYRSQRSRMLNLSLSKLHMARQNHEGSLRRSVLICNMLRYIEDETETEAVQETQQFNNATTTPTTTTTSPPHNMETDQYWTPSTNGQATPTAPEGQPAQQYGPHQQQQQQAFVGPPADTYETTLKDFNSAFRSTPYSSPVHPGTEVDSGLGDNEDRGINWSSVLTLSSQSELDPLNNNTFATETWPSSTATVSSCSTAVAAAEVTTTTLADLETVITTTTTMTATSTTTAAPFDDIGWKLSADDVLKAFPNDENIFVTGP